VGCFQYSEVEGAKANELPNKIPEEIKEERFHNFMTLQQKISAEKLKNKIGKKIKVIVDDIDTKEKVAICRSYSDAPEIDGLVFVKNIETKNIFAGDIIEVLVQNSDEYDLYGVEKIH
jgi:ribosomal protein S12 methylthiotransferase